MSEPYVFVSYSRKQYYVAEQMAASLSANGLPAWLDVQEIPPGADWQTAIDEGIARCTALVVVASRSAYRSTAVQREIAAAQAAGKPIYLAVIQSGLLVKQLKEKASAFDCRFAFEEQVANLARAIRAGQSHHDTIHRRPLSGSMPFGRGKYHQLLLVALCYTVGTIVFLANKRVVIHHPLPQQLIPLVVLIAAPASAWVISLLYSWSLVFAFQRQRPVSFAALEIWPIVNLILMPTLFFFLDIGFLLGSDGSQSALSPTIDPGGYLTYYLTIDDRFGANSLVLSALVLIPYAFVILSEMRRLLILFVAPFAFLLAGVLPVALFVKLSIIVALACALLVTLLWRFFRGHAAQDAFDGNNSLASRLRGFGSACIIAACFLVLIWLLPMPVVVWGSFIIALLVGILIRSSRRVYFYLWGLFHPREQPGSKAKTEASRKWAKWLVPGAFNTDQFRSMSATSWQRITPGTASDIVTWSILSAPADATVAHEIRQVFARYSILREVGPQQAHYHLLALSNTTPRRWIVEQEARSSRGICIIAGPVDITRLGVSLQQNQFVDYRLRRPAALQYLAQALTGERSHVNPALPEDFRRPLGPYPLRLVGQGLRLLGALNLIVGAATLGLSLLPAAPQRSYPLLALNLALGAWCFWEAERLQMRRTTLVTLLLTVAAGIGSLTYWLFSGAASVLLPRGLLVQNGRINGLVSTSMTVIFVLVGAAVAGFVLAALVELARNIAIVRRWLPGIAWRVWRRTLGIPTVRNVNLSFGVYALSILLSASLLCVDSPLRFPRFHEYSLPDASLQPRQLTLAPNGNVWFETGTYHIGYITPTGELHPNYYSVTQPSGCSLLDCIRGESFRLGPDGSLWFATAQGSFNKTVSIVRVMPGGRILRFPLPAGTSISGVQFTFDGSGNVWYIHLAPLSLSLEKDAIGRIDAANHVDEFALPDNSSPAALVRGPDGNMWVTLSGQSAIARVTPGGEMTMFALPSGINPEEMVVGPDQQSLWFTAPETSIIGRLTMQGASSLVSLPAHTRPHGLTVTTDGSIWYASDQADQQHEAVGRIMPDGSVRAYQIAALPAFDPTLIAAPDGGVWLTLYDKIGHIAADGSITLYDVPTLDADLGEMILGTDHHLWFAESPGIIGEFDT